MLTVCTRTVFAATVLARRCCCLRQQPMASAINTRISCDPMNDERGPLSTIGSCQRAYACCVSDCAGHRQHRCASSVAVEDVRHPELLTARYGGVSLSYEVAVPNTSKHCYCMQQAHTLRAPRVSDPQPLIASCVSLNLWKRRNALYSLRTTKAPQTPEAPSNHTITRVVRAPATGISRSEALSQLSLHEPLWAVAESSHPFHHRALSIPCIGRERGAARHAVGKPRPAGGVSRALIDVGC